MKKRFLCIGIVLLLCAALALPVLAATYCAGIDESLPRVDDGARLLMEVPAEALDLRAREMAGQYHMDIVIVTRRGLGGKTPAKYAEDYFEAGGYGWREEETDDVTTANGVLLLLNMVGPGNNDLEIATWGEAHSVFRDGVWEQILDAIVPDLIDMRYRAALDLFLDEAESCLIDYAQGVGAYADPEAPYNQGHYNEAGEYVYGNEEYGYGNEEYGYGYESSFYFNGTIFIVVALIGLVIAFAVVGSMKKKHNTIRTAEVACNYQLSFNLTERQDIFLYSNTTRVRKPEPTTHTSSGGGGFSGGGTRTSSGGSSVGGGGRKF